MLASVSRVYAGYIDGRAQTPRYTQRQLKKLHDALLDAKSSIQDAVRKDFGYSTTEFDIEYFLALDCVKELYSSIDIKRAMEEEYSLANLRDRPSKTTAIGCVYIVPSTHSLLYSTIGPLSAAIAAGNCVIIEVRYNLSEDGGIYS